MKCKRFNLIIIGVATLLLAGYLLFVDGVQGVMQALRSISPGWLLGGVALMAGYWLLEAVILHLAVKPFHKQQRFESTYRTAMIGQFFNCVTPFASGGQPMQIYHMTKSGVPLGISTCALLVKFVVYQFVLTVYSLLTLIFQFERFAVRIPNLKYLVYIGFGVNTAVICGLLCICFFRRQTSWVVKRCVHFCFRIHLVKNEASVMESAEASISQFYEGFQVLKHDIGLLFKMMILSVAQLTLYFLIPFVIFCSFGLEGASVFSMLAAQAFVLNISSFVPLPGAAGGAELSFSAMFAMFFPAGILNVSILIWRLLTFYLPIFAGMFFVMGFQKKTGAKAAPAAPAA